MAGTLVSARWTVSRLILESSHVSDWPTSAVTGTVGRWAVGLIRGPVPASGAGGFVEAGFPVALTAVGQFVRPGRGRFLEHRGVVGSGDLCGGDEAEWVANDVGRWGT